MRRITVIGTGYVGLTTGVCFAELGNIVHCVDIDEAKMDRLREGLLPIHEPGLGEVVVRNLRAGRLFFTTSYTEGMRDADFIFIAVGTPDDGSGGADLSQVRAAAQAIGERLDHQVVVVNKSTVPIGTGDLVTRIVEKYRRQNIRFAVVSNPEFLREGQALRDCMNPDRVVLGSDDRAAAEEVATLYESLARPVIITDLRTAEMIKYASNAFLATRISFINEVASICERLGADVKQVALGMGFDTRIGPHFLDAGLGFGGSCFPKDVNALIRMATDAGTHPQLLEAVMDINRDRRRWVILQLERLLGALDGKVIGLLGIAFKPDTDDIREAPALEIIALLQERGASVRAYDPAAMPNAERETSGVTFCRDAYEVAQGADALVVVTEWKEFMHIDLSQLAATMERPVLVDGRNLYEPVSLDIAGFKHIGVARSLRVPPEAITSGDIEVSTL